MEIPENNGPDHGNSNSSNGANQNQLNLVELFKKGYRAITGEIRNRLLSLTLFAFIEVFALSKLGQLRKKRSQATADAEASHLRTAARLWTGLSTIPIRDLVSGDLGDMCVIINEAKVAGTGERYRTGSYNAMVGAVGRLLRFLGGPPFLLISREHLDEMLAMIEFGDPDSPASCPLPTPGEEDLLVQYIQQRCGRGKRLKSYIAFLLYLFFGVRRNMVRMIDRADVVLEHSEVTVTFNKKRDGKEVRITFAMPPLLTAAFTDYIDYLAEKPPKAGTPFLQIASISKLLHSAAQAAGMTHLTPKTFRKLFITRALEANVDVATIALIVGHTDGGKSILNNYHQYCPKHINGGVKKVNAKYLDLGDADWVEVQRQRSRGVVDVIVEARKDVAIAVVEFLSKLQELIRTQQNEAVLALVRLEKPKLAAEPSEHLPNLPQAQPLSEARLIAANLRVLFWKHGLGYNEVAVELGLSRSAIYDVMRGTRQTAEALQKLAHRFKVKVECLRDPAFPRYDVQLIMKNVRALVARFGIGRLPCPDTLTNVVEKRYLPPGDVLQELAQAVNLPLEELLTKDVSQYPNLELRPCWRTRRPPPVDPTQEEAKRANFAANLRVQLLLAGFSACEAAKAIGTTRPSMMNYAAARCFPPAEVLLKIATFFKSSPEAMCAPAPELNVEEIGRRVSALVGKHGLALSTTAWKMGLAAAKFIQIAGGKALPDGFQLKRLAEFFRVNPAEILGIVVDNDHFAPKPTDNEGPGAGSPRSDINGHDGDAGSGAQPAAV